MEFKWQEFQDYGAETDDEGEYENIDIAVPVIKSDEKIHLPKSESTDFDQESFNEPVKEEITKNVPSPCDHSKFDSELLKLKQENEDLEKNCQKAKNIQDTTEKLLADQAKSILEKDEKVNELKEQIGERNHKISIQKGKCHEFEIQHNILMDLLNVPNDQRNFLGLKKTVEDLKQDYVNENEHNFKETENCKRINRNLEMQNVQLRTERDKFHEEIQNLNHDFHEVDKIRNSLEKENELLKNFQNGFQNFQKDLIDILSISISLPALAISIKKKVQDLKTNNENYGKENFKLKIDEQKFRKEIQNLTQSKVSLEKENADLKNSQNESQNLVTQILNESIQSNQENSHLKLKIESLEKNLKQKDQVEYSKNNTSKSTNSQLCSKIQILEKRLKEKEIYHSNRIKTLNEKIVASQNSRQSIENGLENLTLEKSKVDEFRRHQSDLTEILSISIDAPFSKIKEEVSNLFSEGKKEIEKFRTENVQLTVDKETLMKKLKVTVLKKDIEIQNFEIHCQKISDIILSTEPSGSSGFSISTLIDDIQNLLNNKENEIKITKNELQDQSYWTRAWQRKFNDLKKNLLADHPCNHSKLDSEILKLKQTIEDLEQNAQKAKNIQESTTKQISDQAKTILVKEEKLDELKEQIGQLNQKILIQKGKCDEYETQQNILNELLNVPIDKRSFLGLQKTVENLKEDYVNEKESGNAMALQRNKEIENFEMHKQEILSILTVKNGSFSDMKQEVRYLVNLKEALVNEKENNENEIKKAKNELQDCQRNCSKLTSEMLEFKHKNEDLMKNNQDAKNNQEFLTDANTKLLSDKAKMELEGKKLEKSILESKEKLKELMEKIEQKNQKLSLQKGKCDEFEMQQNILINLLKVSDDQQNFLGLRENIENLKQDYINEKERADNLSLNILEAPSTCDHSTFYEEILKLEKEKEKYKNAMRELLKE